MDWQLFLATAAAEATEAAAQATTTAPAATSGALGELNMMQVAIGVFIGVVLYAVGQAIMTLAINHMSPPATSSGADDLNSGINFGRWSALPGMMNRLTKVTEPNEVFRVIMEITQEQMNCEYSALLILREGSYRFEAGAGLCEESRQAFKLDAKSGLVDFMRDKSQSVALTRSDRQLQEFKFLREPISDVILTPLRTGSNIFALLFVANKAKGQYDKHDLDMMAFLAMPFALALYQAINYKRSQGGVVRAIVEIIRGYERNRPYCDGHSDRVVKLAEAMGRELRMNSSELESLRMAAWLHDLGKISIPLELHFCETLPEGPERELVANQDRTAVAWLKPLGFVEKALPLILQHHERYDGSGFPNGMRGPAISMGAMVIAVAETFDLLTHDQPDRPGRPPAEVKAYIESLSNTKFDPQVIRAFMAVMASPPSLEK